MSLAFKTKKKDGCDEYYTPRQAWQDIDKYIPKDKLVWEAFYGDGTSADYLRELGCNVVSEDVDFFQSNLGEIIISNPPYSFKKKVFERLRQINKPFILLVPVSTITKAFFQAHFAKHCGVIIPKKRIHFIRNGEQTSRSWFDVIYICYQIKGVQARELIYL